MSATLVVPNVNVMDEAQITGDLMCVTERLLGLENRAALIGMALAGFLAAHPNATEELNTVCDGLTLLRQEISDEVNNIDTLQGFEEARKVYGLA